MYYFMLLINFLSRLKMVNLIENYKVECILLINNFYGVVRKLGRYFMYFL